MKLWETGLNRLLVSWSELPTAGKKNTSTSGGCALSEQTNGTGLMGCQKVFVESAATLLAQGSTWWCDPTGGFPARLFGTTLTAVIRRVGRRLDLGRFVGSVEISGFHGFRLHGFESGVSTLATVVRRA